MDRMAGGALPAPPSQALEAPELPVHMSAAAAGLGARRKAGNHHEGLPLPCTLVPQLTADLSKRRIRQRICQLVVLQHPLDAQILDGYHVGLALAELICHLVYRVCAGCLDPLLHLRHLHPGLVAVP